MPISSTNGDPLRRRLVLLSPILLAGLGFFVARLADVLWGAWSWSAVLVYYWVSLIALVAWAGAGASVRRWLRPSRRDRWIWVWRILGLVVPALALPTAFLSGLASMTGWWVPLLWFGLGIVNAWIEEGYWRGLLLEAAPGWTAMFYSAICFAAVHPLLFGWQGDSWKGIVDFGGTLVAGVIWGLVYRQTRSLRLPVLGHVLQQILAPPYSVFAQLIDLLS